MIKFRNDAESLVMTLVSCNRLLGLTRNALRYRLTQMGLEA
jgi:hypothetical protein